MDNQQSQSFKPKTDHTMDNSKTDSPQADEQGIGDKPSSVAGGGTGGTGDSQSYLDKGRLQSLSSKTLRLLMMFQCTGISYLQQSIIGKGGQTNEKSTEGDTSHHAAVDAAHPEKISEFLRDQNKSMTNDEGK